MFEIVQGKPGHTICYRCERNVPDDRIAYFEHTPAGEGAPPGHLTGFGLCEDCYRRAVDGGDS